MSDESNLEIQAIETHYDGYRFRSRLEARWAVFFNTLGIEYRYEPEGFELPSGNRYLPDFHLPNIGLRSTRKNGLWVEIKSKYSKEEWNTLAEFAKAKDADGALLTKDVINEWSGGANYEAPLWDNHMIFVKCRDCGRIKYEFSESNYMECEECGGKCSNNHSEIERAVNAARKARFEHGEKP